MINSCCVGFVGRKKLKAFNFCVFDVLNIITETYNTMTRKTHDTMTETIT